MSFFHCNYGAEIIIVIMQAGTVKYQCKGLISRLNLLESAFFGLVSFLTSALLLLFEEETFITAKLQFLYQKLEHVLL